MKIPFAGKQFGVHALDMAMMSNTNDLHEETDSLRYTPILRSRRRLTRMGMLSMYPRGRRR